MDILSMLPFGQWFLIKNMDIAKACTMVLYICYIKMSRTLITFGTF